METERNDDHHDDEDALQHRYVVDGDDFVMRMKGEQLGTTSDEVNGHFQQKKKTEMDDGEDCIHQDLGTRTWNVELIEAMLGRKHD